MTKKTAGPARSTKKTSKTNAERHVPRAPLTIVVRDYELTDWYLATIFHSFILQNQHQVGVWFPFGTTFKYAEKRWVGLTNPAIFYLITEIVPEEHSKYAPTLTTVDKWDIFTHGKGEHPPLPNIIARLMERNYIRRPKRDDLDSALKNATEEYVKNHEELAKRTLQGKTGEDAQKLIADSLLEVHSTTHLIKNTWCFTDEFLELVKKYGEMSKKA
jgi:hypothetical protein